MARQGFNMPTGDRRYADPELPGGGGGVEHQHGNDASTYTPDPSELDRYRGLGEAASKRQAYQVDYGKALGDEAQGLQDRSAQVAGIDNMRQAAMGGAPSQAAILGGQVGGQSLQQSMAAGAGARGLGAATAQMQAQQGMGQQQLGAMGQYAGMRGAEMQHAQQSYGQAGGAMRAGDYAQQGMAQQRAETQGQMQLGQDQLNQGAQMGYEQMGINDQQQNVDAQARKAAMQAQTNADQNAAHDARNARNMQIATSGMAAVGSFGAAASDVRAKQGVTMLSDDRTKLVAAQREAFTAGLKHASDAQETGTFGPVPDYVEGHGKRQPAAAERKAATPLAKADPAKQNAENAASQAAYDRANAASLAAVPLGYGGTLGALHGTLAENHMQQARRPPPPPAAPPAPSMLSRAPNAVADTLGRLYPSTSDGPTDMSDERAKQGAHAESDMGAALEQGYKPFEYEYKDGFRESEGQKPGEKNVGPMAQNMAKNSITGNAVEQGPDGLLRISIPKTVKTNSAGIGYLAAKMRQQDEEIAKLKGGR